MNASKNSSHLVDNTFNHLQAASTVHLQHMQCTVSKYCVCEAYIKRGNDCDLRAYYLLWAGEEACSNSGQSERQFWVFSLPLSLLLGD